jgi:protein-disulfide isomerase
VAGVIRAFLTTIAVASVTVSASAQVTPEKAAAVNGTPILTADVDAKLGNNLAQLQEQIFNLRQRQLNSMIDQKLLESEAAKRGVTIAGLVQSEIMAHVTLVTNEDVARFYDENRTKLQGDLPALEGQIRNFLTAQRVEARQKEFLKSLRAAARIELLLPAPPVFRSEVATSEAPVRGASTAPVTLIEFSDFHCPYCRRVQPVLDELRGKYGDRIKIVYRDFPLDNLHPQARAAAEAARCAVEQGKFWEFHDKLFKADPDSSPATLDRFASEVGMDVKAFAACRASGKYKASVQASTQEGTKLGITGTPTFFINGRLVVGAQPIDAFAKIIDDELALAEPRSSSVAAER